MKLVDIEKLDGDTTVSSIKDEDIVFDGDDIGEMSDGYHTFNSLYHQRLILFATLVGLNRDKSWKSWKHEDGEKCFGGGLSLVSTHQTVHILITMKKKTGIYLTAGNCQLLSLSMVIPIKMLRGYFH